MKHTSLRSFVVGALLLPLALLISLPLAAGQRDKAPKPRNLIYMIGDGMGLAQVSMLMIEGGYAETPFDRMENVALITTYSANNRVTDSAAAGTALATGHKTHNGSLGVTPDGEAVPSIIERAIHKGFRGGVVVTCELQHATPGAFYAHTPNRGYYPIIAHQLVESGLDVALGGGRKTMLEADSAGMTPARAMADKGYRVVEEFSELEQIEQGKVVGLFAEGHLPSKLAGRDDYLPRATQKALSILEKNSQKGAEGFVLMVEGSQIDFEGHGNNTAGLLAEVRDFAEAVEVAMRYVDAHPETLLVVTADHETGGLAIPSGNSDFTTSESGIHYRYGTGSHTGIMVPVYLYGCGAEQINGLLDNTELARKLFKVMGLE